MAHSAIWQGSPCLSQRSGMSCLTGTMVGWNLLKNKALPAQSRSGDIRGPGWAIRPKVHAMVSPGAEQQRSRARGVR